MCDHPACQPHGDQPFLVRGEEAKSMMSSVISSSGGEPPAKKRRTKGNIANFFGPRDDKKKDFDAARAVLMKAHSESTREETEDDLDDLEEDAFDEHNEVAVDRPTTPTLEQHESNNQLYRSDTPPSAQPQRSSSSPQPHKHKTGAYQHAETPKDPTLQQKTLDTYFCAQCNIHLPTPEKAEHEDYHFALDLSKEMRHEERNQPTPAQAGRKVPEGQKPTRGRGRPPGGGAGRGSGSGVEKGQAKLAFGRGT